MSLAATAVDVRPARILVMVTGPSPRARYPSPALESCHRACVPSNQNQLMGTFVPMSTQRILRTRSQSVDVAPPRQHERILLGILAQFPDATLAKRQLVLRIDQRGGTLRVQLVDAAGAQDAIPEDRLILLGAHGASDFGGQLVAD